MGGDGDAAAGVGLDEIDGVVPLDEGEAVPEEGFGGNLRFEIWNLRLGRRGRDGGKLAIGPVGVGGGAAAGLGGLGELVEPAIGVLGL